MLAYRTSCNKVCSDIVSLNGNILQWVESIIYLGYLGVYLLRARQFKCNYDNAKSSFYRAFNAVFGRIGRSGSEEVILQLINSKCLPCLLYATEACPVNTSSSAMAERPRELDQRFQMGGQFEAIID